MAGNKAVPGHNLPSPQLATDRLASDSVPISPI